MTDIRWAKMLKAVQWKPVHSILRKEIIALAKAVRFGSHDSSQISDDPDLVTLPLKPVKKHAPLC